MGVSILYYQTCITFVSPLPWNWYAYFISHRLIFTRILWLDSFHGHIFPWFKVACSVQPPQAWLYTRSVVILNVNGGFCINWVPLWLLICLPCEALKSAPNDGGSSPIRNESHTQKSDKPLGLLKYRLTSWVCNKTKNVKEHLNSFLCTCFYIPSLYRRERVCVCLC